MSKHTVITPEAAQGYLRDVEPAWKAFWFRTGVIALNLADLSAALRNLGDEDYGHHVSGSHNDIAAWVGQVIGDEALSSKLSRAKNRAAAAAAVETRLEELQTASQAINEAPKTQTRPKARGAVAAPRAVRQRRKKVAASAPVPVPELAMAAAPATVVEGFAVTPAQAVDFGDAGKKSIWNVIFGD